MAKAKNTSNTEVKNEKLSKDIVLVQFVKSWTPYVKGEVAGFDKKMAEKLIDHDFAIEHKK